MLSIRSSPALPGLFVVIIALLSACHENRPAPPPSVLPSSVPPMQHVYALRDSFVADGGPMAYPGARLYRDGKPIDTVFSGFGLPEVGKDSILYRKLLVYADTARDSATDTVMNIILSGEDGGLYLYDKAAGIKTKLSAGLPYYNDFSSPNSSAGSLLYWGVAKADPEFRIYAMRYGFATRKIDSTFLYLDGLATDNTEYFPDVERVNGAYSYPAADGSSIVLDSAFRRIATIPPPRQDSLARQLPLDRQVGP